MATADPNSPPYVILAAVSLDETGEFALAEAARVARARGLDELHVVHVVSESDSAVSDQEFVSLDARLASAPRAIERRIRELQAAIGTPPRVIAHIRAGDPVRSIVQASVDIAADLIVVGSHRRSGLQRWMLGSTAEQVLHHARCPVLIAFPKNYAGLDKSETIEPPCPDCMIARQQSQGVQYWCERHSHRYEPPHIYEGTNPVRTGVSFMPTH